MTEQDTSGSDRSEFEDDFVEVPEDEVEPDTDREPLSPTDEDIEDGNHLGLAIDPNDDSDTGARETYL